MLTDPESDPLAAIRGELDHYRATLRRGRFLGRLWQQAVEFAGQQGVERVACDLGLDEYGVRGRMMATIDLEPSVPEYPAFVYALIWSITDSTPSTSSSAMASGSAEIECSCGRPLIGRRGSALDLGAIVPALVRQEKGTRPETRDKGKKGSWVLRLSGSRSVRCVDSSRKPAGRNPSSGRIEDDSDARTRA